MYSAAEATVGLTDVFAFCETTNFAKQLSTRMSSLSGFFDLFSTIGVSFLKNYIAPGKNQLYNSMYSFAMKDTSCEDAANKFGRILQYTFSYQVAEANYAEQLPLDLVSDVF